LRPVNGFLLSELSGTGTDDCDDTNENIHPGATEILNGLDDDCDGYTDENSLWISDAEVNNLIRRSCDPTTDLVEAVSDGAGGMIAVWEQLETTGGSVRDIYAQRINANGEVLWGAEGVAICTAPDNQSQIKVISDGAGGAIIVWKDERDMTIGGGTGDDIYAQKVNSNGVVQWTADGVPVCTAVGRQMTPYLCSDGSGGAYIAWADARAHSTLTLEIFGQRLNATGNIQWQTNGIALTDNVCNKVLRGIIHNNAGSAIIAYVACEYAYGLKFDLTGNITWQTTLFDNSATSNSPAIQKIVSDGAGGGIVALNHGLNLYAQRVNANGVRQWGTINQPVLISQTDGGGLYGGATIADGLGGIILAWNDNRHGNLEVYAQKVNNAGTIQWQANGIRVTNTANGAETTRLSMLSNGAGGAILVVKPNQDGLYAQQLNSTGAFLWGVNGKVVSHISAGASFYPFLANDDNCEAIIGFKRPTCLRASKISCAGNLLGQESYVRIAPKIFLQGAWNGSNMNDNLRQASLLPTTEPFTSLGFTHLGGGGGETVDPAIFAVTGNDAIVDWIFLQLRSKNNSATVLHTRAALLQRDGDIVDIDGVSPVFFAERDADDYYLAVRHRNHIGVMSTGSPSFSNIICDYNFTSDPANSTGSTNGIANLGGGNYGLFSGDFNNNGQVQNTDVTGLIPNIGNAGYSQGDLDMNGQVQNTDLQLYLIPNIGRGAQFQY